MRNKNLLIILILALVVVAVAAVAILMPKETPTPPPSESIEAELTAPGYVFINAGNEGRWFQLPENEDTITLRRTMEDGTEMVNEIKLTNNSMWMASSTCDNQDCVDQGVVSFENKDDRILMNFIICLPNQVSIELYTRDEMAALLAAAEAEAANQAQ